jgi:hypothetical protein
MRFKNGKMPIKIHESALKSFLDASIETGEILPYTSHDKQVTPGLDPLLYGSNRPDWLWKMKDRWVFLECDEHAHGTKAYSCERRRELELCNSAGGLPVIFIRFNPDAFKTGTMSARVKPLNTSSRKRHELVIETLKYAIQAPDPAGLTFTRLFYPCECMGEGSIHPCGFKHTTTYDTHEAFLKSHQM